MFVSSNNSRFLYLVVLIGVVMISSSMVSCTNEEEIDENTSQPLSVKFKALNILRSKLINKLKQEELNSDSDDSSNEIDLDKKSILSPRIGTMKRAPVVYPRIGAERKRASIYQPRVGRRNFDNFDSDEDMNNEKRAVLRPRIG